MTPSPPQPDPPRLTDRAALARQRARARNTGIADFLHALAADEIEVRLAEVNRSFTDAVVVSGFPELWRRLWPSGVVPARHVADAPVLDLDSGAHDLVVHALALHWADDPVGQLVQCRRALRPDGLFLAVTFGNETLVALRQALARAEAEILGGLSPRVAPMPEIRDLGALMQRAGLAQPVADLVPQTVSYADPMALMRDLRAMGEGNALADRHRRPVPRSLFARAAEILAQTSGDGSGRIVARFDLVFLTGWAPAPGQQKPLRPGSAAQRLADALGTSETKLDP